MNFADKVRLAYPRDSFTEQDLRLVLAGQSDAAIHNGISRALKHEDFIRLKRGFYVFGDRLRKGAISNFEIANRLYAPSYISFESALSHHGLIPEAVYVTTSPALRRDKKVYETPIGVFEYHYVPKSAFMQGVVHRNGVNMANPIKALFDWVYSRRRHYHSLHDIETDLRIEAAELLKIASQYSIKEVSNLAESYQKNTTRKLLRLLKPTPR